MTKDLIVLVADTHIKATLDTLLKYRRPSLRIGEVEFTVFSHPHHDGGVRAHAHTMLGEHCGTYRNAIVVFDHKGCGEEDIEPEDIEKSVTDNLIKNGWTEDCVLVVVIRPELEAWVWSDSPEVAEILDWSDGGTKGIKSHLGENGFTFDALGKPDNPKEAMRCILRKTDIAHSASTFQKLAKIVSLERCRDPSFLRLCDFLRRKFPRA